MVVQFIQPLLLAMLAVLSLAYGFATVIYRLWMHPLKEFPGPVFASVTNWHKFYYNWYCNGLHSEKIRQWHEEYGSIIRIAPNELHFSDPDAHKVIYTNHDLQKEPAFYQFMTEDSLIGKLSIHESKRCRKIFAGFFSTNAVRTHGNIDGILWAKAHRLTDLLTQLCSGNQRQVIINMTDLSKCFTYDILKEVVLGHSDELSTTSPDFKHPFIVANSQIRASLWLAQQFPFLVHIVRKLPRFLLSSGLHAMRLERENCCNEVLNRSPGFDGCPSPRSDSVTVCSKVIETRYWQPKIRISDYHLGMEIFDFFMAGTELPANAISFSVFRVARNPLIIERLRQELHDVGFLVNCNFQSLTVLEKLPFLNAVVKETLRLGNLVPGRLPRVTPPEGMSVAGQHIPGGSVVSASTHLVHMNPSIFPEPEKFMPERWLDDTPGRFKLEKYLVAFSSGGRDCVGRELGFAEIRVFIACLVSFFDLELANREDYFLDLGWRDNLVSSYERDVLVAIREKK